MVLVVLDAAIANVALPAIARSLGVMPGMAVWVVTAYQLGLVIALLPAAAYGERLGYRRVFASGTALLVGASVACALSPSLTWLVLARFAQGMGGAAIMALGMALLRMVVPQARLGAAIGWYAMTVALSSAAGPTLGAAILSIASWHWLFIVNLPLGAAVLVAARALPAAAGETARGVDVLSVALNACAIAGFVFAAELASTMPYIATGLLVGSVVLAALLVQRELGSSAPLVPLDLLRAPSFCVSIVASTLCFTGQGAGLLALSFHLQYACDLTPLTTGLYLTPWPLAVAVAGPLAGRLADRIPTSWLCLAGALLLAAGLGAAAFLPLRGNPLALGCCTMACGLGFGMFNVPNNRNMFLSAPRERSAAAGGLQALARLVGQTCGAVIMSLLLGLMPLDVACRMGLALSAAAAFAAGLASVLRVNANDQGSR
jgi:DHA2 family multidrug resistance protein-like MFS transporter